jgi:putative hydrolase of HD superfamily
MKNNLEKVFNFATLISKLKTEKRFKATKKFDGDTVASHSWRLAVLTFLIAEELKLDVDILRAVKLALVHDFPEAITGDIDAHLVHNDNHLKTEKIEKENIAINELSAVLSDLQGIEIKNLWMEYSNQESKEAKYVYALDKIEGLYTFIEVDGVDHYHNYDLMAKYCVEGYKIFPELKPVLDFIQNKVRKKFEDNGIEWKKEYDN